MNGKADMANVGADMSVLRDLLKKMSALVITNCKTTKALQHLKEGNEIVRQSTRAQYGDICIPRGVVAVEFPTQHEVQEVVHTILSVGEAEGLPLPVLSCVPCENGFISIRLHRAPAFRRGIGEVVSQGRRYGHRGVKRAGSVLLNVPESTNRGTAAEGTDLVVLRQSLVAQHVTALLEANGFTVRTIQLETRTSSPPVLARILGEESTPTFSDTGKPPNSNRILPAEVVRQLERIKETYKETNGEAGLPTSSDILAKDQSDSSGECLKPLGDGGLKNCRLNLGAYIEKRNLRRGKRGYSPNVSHVLLTDMEGEPTQILQQCLNLRNAAEKTPDGSLCVLHVMPSSQQFIQQTVDLTMRALMDGSVLSQHHLCCAPVGLQGKKTQGRMSVEEFHAVRESQMREASILKYGDEVKGESWRDMIQTLTEAGIKFDILGTQCKHEVKLDVGMSGDSNPWPDNRNGVFVVYNYARLSTLFSRFQERVQNGTYLPLPALESVDFSTLKEDMEWRLLFTHILSFPDVVADSVRGAFLPQDLSAQCETQHICRYLIALSQDLSTYYSRFKILLEPRPHLLPTMYARLYLLKAVHQVLENGLALLRIKPLTRM